MAAVEVNKWTDFLEQIKIANNEITLTADLDCNDAPFTQSVIMGQNTIINGNKHTIYNLSPTASFNRALFINNANPQSATEHYNIFNEVNFYNIYRSDAYPIFLTSGSVPLPSGGVSRGIYFNNCNFQGKSQFLFSGAVLNFCAVNYDLSFDGSLNAMEDSSSDKIVLNYTYVNVKASYTSKWSSNKGILSYRDMVCTNSYITGDITINDERITGSLVGSGANKVTNSVFNLRSTNAPDRTQVCTSTSSFTSPLSVYNSDVFKKQTSITSAGLIPCTTAELKTAQILADKGFDIIVT